MESSNSLHRRARPADLKLSSSLADGGSVRPWRIPFASIGGRDPPNQPLVTCGWADQVRPWRIRTALHLVAGPNAAADPALSHLWMGRIKSAHGEFQYPPSAGATRRSSICNPVDGRINSSRRGVDAAFISRRGPAPIVPIRSSALRSGHFSDRETAAADTIFEQALHAREISNAC